MKEEMDALSKQEINRVFKELDLDTEDKRKTQLFNFEQKSEEEVKKTHTVLERNSSKIESENAIVG